MKNEKNTSGMQSLDLDDLNDVSGGAIKQDNRGYYYVIDDDTGERNRYWEECKDAFNNCIDAIKDARNEVNLKRDEYFVQINNIIESKK